MKFLNSSCFNPYSNGSSFFIYENLVLIADDLNYGGEEEAFARFILGKALKRKQIEALALELLKNESNYKSILWPVR